MLRAVDEYFYFPDALAAGVLHFLSSAKIIEKNIVRLSDVLAAPSGRLRVIVPFKSLRSIFQEQMKKICKTINLDSFFPLALVRW